MILLLAAFLVELSANHVASAFGVDGIWLHHEQRIIIARDLDVIVFFSRPSHGFHLAQDTWFHGQIHLRLLVELDFAELLLGINLRYFLKQRHHGYIDRLLLVQKALWREVARRSCCFHRLYRLVLWLEERLDKIDLILFVYHAGQLVETGREDRDVGAGGIARLLRQKIRRRRRQVILGVLESDAAPAALQLPEVALACLV